MLALEHFDFEKEYILENERVLLRPLLIADLSLLAQYVVSEPALWQYSLVSVNDKAG